MKIGFDAALGIHPDALRLRARRTEILANNIANADTPNFKARDIDFDSALATQTGSAPAALRTTHANHLQAARGTSGGELLYRTPVLPSLDGNTVDGHVEQAAFADNSLHFLASLRFLDGRFKALVTAIKGD